MIEDIEFGCNPRAHLLYAASLPSTDEGMRIESHQVYQSPIPIVLRPQTLRREGGRTGLVMGRYAAGESSHRDEAPQPQA